MKTRDREITKETFKKIDRFLDKKGHEKVVSVYLENYNNQNIYVRFDYVKKISIFKAVYFDLNFIDLNHLDNYMNIQAINRLISYDILNVVTKINVKQEVFDNPDIIGDRVHITIKKDNKNNEYTFTRFLPKKWKVFAEPLALIFSYLPRTFDDFLNEIFAPLDDTEDYFTYRKPIKLNIEKTPLDNIFSPKNYKKGKSIYEQDKVLFLEEINNKYIALIVDKTPNLVTLTIENEDFTTISCNCEETGACSHICATILAIREHNFKNFMKIKSINDDTNLLNRLNLSDIYLYCGHENENALLSDLSGRPLIRKIIENGKFLFEIIEDDENDTLAKEFEKIKKKYE